MRDPRPWSCLGVCALLWVACGGSGAAPARNALIVTVDTLRADAIGPYGADLPTPGFQALAREGVLVEGACTPTPSTAPAHASLLTGLHPWNHGVLTNASPVPDDLPHLAVLAGEAGLETGAFVSSYIVAERFFGRGFQHFHFEPSSPLQFRGEVRMFWNPGEETTDAALAWLADRGEQRFLAWIHYFDPHAPYGPPERHRRPADERIDLNGKSLPERVESLGHLAGLIRNYRGEVAYVDEQIQRLLDGLRQLDLLDTTALVVTSDHGEGLGDHGWLGHGVNLHDELVLVPLLARLPGVEGGRRLLGAAQLEDLMPTVLSLLDLPVPDGLDGVDLSTWLRGETPHSPRDAVVGRRRIYDGEPTLFFQRRWPQKWIGPQEGGGDTYWLATDPRESRADAEPMPGGLAERLGAARGVPVEPDLDAESLRALEALGYLDPADGGARP